MGTVIVFPVEVATRRSGQTEETGGSRAMGTVVILPVIRVERMTDGSDDQDPGQGAAAGRGRRRRMRS